LLDTPEGPTAGELDQTLASTTKLKTGPSAGNLQPFIERFCRYEEESAEASLHLPLPYLREKRLQQESTQSLRQSAPAGFIAARQKFR